MGIAVEYEKNPRYLFVKVTGKWTTQNAYKAMDDIKIEADKQKMNHILIDFMDLSLPESNMDRFYSGEKIAALFKYKYKIAGYSLPEKITRFAEIVAANRGANFKVFFNKTDAIGWLIG